MKKIIRKFILIPLWILIKLIKPTLPETHPWKHKKCSLEWWCNGATPLSVQFGFIMWVYVLMMSIFIGSIIINNV
jgi:hypothetical protein